MVVGHRLTVNFGGQQVADHVVAGVRLALVDSVPEEAVDLLAVLHPDLRIGQAELEHAANPLDELVRALLTDAEHVRDHPHRDLLGVVDGGIGVTVLDETGDQPAAHLPGGVLVGVDGAGREEGQDQASGPCVLRRVGADRWCLHGRRPGSGW